MYSTTIAVTVYIENVYIEIPNAFIHQMKKYTK